MSLNVKDKKVSLATKQTHNTNLLDRKKVNFDQSLMEHFNRLDFHSSLTKAVKGKTTSVKHASIKQDVFISLGSTEPVTSQNKVPCSGSMFHFCS